MKKLLFLLTFCFLTATVFAQDKAIVKKEVSEWASLYNLDKNQKTVAQSIQMRKLNNLTEIESLKTVNPQLYLKKRQAINYNTEASLKRLLNEEQKAVFDQRQKELRANRAAKAKQMMAEGASKEAIQAALLEIE